MTWIIDDVPLSTLAFNVSNRSAGWKVPGKRGDNLTIPGRNGAQWLPNKSFEQGSLVLSMWANGADPETGLLPEDRTSAQQCRDNLDQLTALFAQTHKLLEVTQISGAAFGMTNVSPNPGFAALTPSGYRTYRNVVTNPAMRRTGLVPQARNLFSNPNVLTGQSPLWVPVFENLVADPYAKYQRTTATLYSPGVGNYWYPANSENYNANDTWGTLWATAASTTALVAANGAADQTANPLGGTKYFRITATAGLAANALLGTRNAMFATDAGNGKPLLRLRIRRGMTGSTTRGVQIRMSTVKADNTTVVLAGTWQTFMLPAYTGGGPADWIDAVYAPGSLVIDAANARNVKVEFRTNEAWLTGDALTMDLGMVHVQGYSTHPNLVGSYWDGVPGPYYDGDSGWGTYYGTAGNANSVSRWDTNHDTRWTPAAPTGPTSAYWALADRPSTSDPSGTTLGFIAYGFTTGATQTFTYDCLPPTQTVPYTLYANARALTGAAVTIDLQKKSPADPDFTSVPGTPISFTGTGTGIGTGTRMNGTITSYAGQTYTPQPGDLFRVKVTVPVRTDGHHVLQLSALTVTNNVSANFSGDTGNTTNSQYAWAGTTYNSISVRSHRAAWRLTGTRNIMVTTAITPPGYAAPINAAEAGCIADDDRTAVGLEQITLPTTNRGLYVRGSAIYNTTGIPAAGTPAVTARVEASFVDSGGTTLTTLVGATVTLNLLATNNLLPLTLAVAPESIPAGAVGARIAFSMVNPKRCTILQVGEIGVYDSGLPPARLGGMPDFFTGNTANAAWLGPTDDAVSEYRITAPLGYTLSAGAVPCPITGALAAKSSSANTATVTFGVPLGDTFTAGRYLAGIEAACRAEDVLGDKITGATVLLNFAFYSLGSLVYTTTATEISGNETFDTFQGAFDIPGDFDEMRVVFTAQAPLPNSITAEVKRIYVFDNIGLCPLPRLGGNRVANPGFADGLALWGYNGQPATPVNTVKGHGYTLGADTRLSGNPFPVTPGQDLNVAVWGADGLQSSLYWNAIIARRNLCPNPSFEDPLDGFGGGGASCVRDNAWSLDGSYAVKITPPGGGATYTSYYLGPPTSDSGAALAYLNLVKGRTYRCSATIRLTSAQTGTLDPIPRAIFVGVRRSGVNSTLTSSTSAANTAGVSRLSVTFTVPTDVQDCFIRLNNGSTNATEPVWWDSVLVEEISAVETLTNWLKSPSAEAPGLPDWITINASKQQVTTNWTGKVSTNSLLATVATPNLMTFGDNGTFEANITGWYTAGTTTVRTNLAKNPSFEVDTSTWVLSRSSLTRMSDAWALKIGSAYARMAAASAQLASNGTFDTDITGWSATGPAAVVRTNLCPSPYESAAVGQPAVRYSTYSSVSGGVSAVTSANVYNNRPVLRVAMNSGWPTQPNLVTNGTFEGGSLTGWTTNGNTQAADTTIKHSGSYSLKQTFAAAAAGTGSSATVTGLTVGQAYTLEGWVYVPADSISAQVVLRMSGITAPWTNYPIVTTPDTWVQTFQSFTATATSHVVFLSSQATTTAGQTAYLDDVKLYAQQNLCVAGENGTFEGGNLSGWTGGGTPPTTAAESTTVRAGTGSMKITWPSAALQGSTTSFTLNGLTVSRMYVLEAWLYVPTGSCDAAVAITGLGVGNIVTQRDQWVLSRYVFTANATSHTASVTNRAASTAGQVCYVDDAKFYALITGSYLGMRTNSAINIQSVPADTTFWFSADVYIPSDVTANALNVIFRDDPNADSNATTIDPSTPSSVALDMVASTNLAMNPNCETNITGWNSNDGTKYTGTRDTTNPITGTASFLLTRTATNLDGTGASAYFGGQVPNTHILVNPSTAYSAGITLKSDQANRRARIGFVWYNSGGTQVGSLQYTGYTNLTANTAARLNVTTTSPPTAAKAYLVVLVEAVTGNAVAGEQTWFDSFSFEQGTTSGAYFDGGTAAGGGYVYRWTGTANQSTTEKITTGAIPRNQWVRVAWKATVKTGKTLTGIYLTSVTATGVMQEVNTWIETTRWLVEISSAASAGDYFDGDGGRYNYVTNPDLEGNVSTQWSSTNLTAYPAALDSTQPISGSYSYMATRQAASLNNSASSIAIMSSPRVPCGVTPVTFGLAVRTEQSGRRAQLSLLCYDASGTYIGPAGASYAATDMVGGQTYWPKITATPLPNTTSCYLGVVVSTMSGNAVAGERVWYDNAIAEMGTSLAGGAGQWPVTTPAVVHAWSGTAGTSTSTRTAQVAISRETQVNRVRTGAGSLRIDLPAMSASPGGGGTTTVSGLTVSRVYTVEAWIYCPGDSIACQPSVRVAGIASGNIVTTADQWVKSILTFTATATSHTIYAAATNGAATDGMRVYVDDVRVYDAYSGYVSLNLTTPRVGDVIYAQCRVGQPSTSLRMQFSIGFYQGATLLRFDTGPLQTVNPGQDLTLNATSLAAPANTDNAYVYLYIMNPTGSSYADYGLAINVDGFMFTVNEPITDYFDGSGARANLAVNADLETGGLTGWASNDGTQYPMTLDTAAPIRGTASAMTTRTATSLDAFPASINASGQAGRLPVTAGMPYTMAVDIGTELPSRQARCYFNWYDAGGALLSTSNDNAYQALTDGAITRVKHTATAPAGTASAYAIIIVRTVTGNAVAGERCWFDNLSIEQGTTSGSWPVTTPAVVYAWTGTAHASTSTRTAKAAIARDTGRYHYGAAALRLDAPAGVAAASSYTYATINGLTIGKTYTASAWLFVPADSISAGFGLGVATFGSPARVGVTTPDQWVRQTYTFTATGTAHSILVTITANSPTPEGARVFVDDVKVWDTASPLPIIYPLGTDASGRIPVKQGDTVFGQVNVGATDAPIAIRLGVAFYDADGNYVDGTGQANQVLQSGESTTLGIISDPVPGGATTAVLLIYPTRDNGSVPPGLAVLIDGAIVQINQTIVEYFDGNTADTSTAFYDWTGTAQASPSTRQSIDFFDHLSPRTTSAFYRLTGTVAEKITYTAITEVLSNADGDLNLAATEVTVPGSATTALLFVENPELPIRWSELPPDLRWIDLDPTLTWSDAGTID